MSTHGCVRLYSDAMHLLFDDVPAGTSVRIVYQPIKIGQVGPTIYLEAHPDLYARAGDPVAAAFAKLDELGLLQSVNAETVIRVVDDARGNPVPIGARPIGTSLTSSRTY